MKTINKFLVLLIILMFLPLSPIISSAVDIQQVGWGPNDIEGFDGDGNPLPAPEVTESEDNYERDPEIPREYDPNNPYAEWEN